MNRKTAEKLAKEMTEAMEVHMKVLRKEHPEMWMTDERREELGIPDVRDDLNESLILELMKHPAKNPEDNE